MLMERKGPCMFIERQKKKKKKKKKEKKIDLILSHCWFTDEICLLPENISGIRPQTH